MTAATPMIMPSIVRAVRILFRPSAFSAIRKTINSDMLRILRLPGCGFRRQRCELVSCEPAARHRPIPHDLSVSELNDPGSVLGDVVLVRDEQDGDAPLGIQPLK